MWIEIKKDIFLGIDLKGLNFILQLLTWHPTNSIPRYNILVKYDDLEHTENYNQLSEFDKQIIEEEFDKAITEGVIQGKYIITKKNKRPHTLNIEEAVRFLNQPVSIIIENSLNDSYFLQAIFKHFDKKTEEDKRRLTEYIKNDWIQFVNAGGWTNIRNYIEGKLKSYDYLAAINQKDSFVYLRCFVMMDSDKEYPSQSIKEKEKLKTELEAQNIKVHILKKRAMENYMPDELIQQIPSLKGKQFKSWVAVYGMLSQLQKDFLNYKEGFPKGKRRTEQSTKIQHLYSNLDNSQYKILDKGLNLRRFKDTFPSFFESNPSSSIHKTSLLARESGTEEENEFLEILQKINDLL